MKYSIRQLEVFIAVGRSESVSRAAEQLGMSQSATSTSLAEFERQFDTRLFDRVGKKLQLNELGRMLLPHAMELIDRAVDIEALLQGRNGFGPLRIGASLTIGNYLAIQLMGEFRVLYPVSNILLEVHNTARIVKKVVEFSLDFGLIEGNCSHAELVVVPWVDDELVIFAAPDHPLVRQEIVSLDELVRTPWIVREAGSGTRQTFEYAMRHVLSKLNILMELEHTEAIKRAVEAGMGISCISRLALREAFRRGSLAEVKTEGLDLRRQFHFIWHRHKFHTLGIQAFIELCQTVTHGAVKSDDILLNLDDRQKMKKYITRN
ncbi:MAG: LysR family transcriptional regulator [Pseudomonadota bacterium]|nr:LysR family transcriptional regulator [Pseudomonadota bacterium]